MSKVLDEVDRFASKLLGAVFSKIREIWALRHDGHGEWEGLKLFLGLFGMALVGWALFYVFFVNKLPDPTWLEGILAFVGMILLSMPLIAVVVLGYMVVAGIAMLGGGILLKIIVIVGRFVRSALTQLRSEEGT